MKPFALVALVALLVLGACASTQVAPQTSAVGPHAAAAPSDSAAPSAPALAASTAAPGSDATAAGDPPSTSAAGGKCTIGGAPFNAAFAKREDDQDDNAVRVFIFSASPANGAERKSACDRATPIPAFATKSDKHVVEVDFNDAGNLTSNFDVTFLTRTTGDSFMHDGTESPVAELKGSGAAQTIHVNAKTDDDACDLTVRVVTCPSK